jgi:hypothetical protein
MAIISNTYTGDGVTNLYSVSFPYIDDTDVVVSINGTKLTRTVDWFFSTASFVQFISVPANGDEILIERETNNETLKFNFFPGSAIRAKDLNDNFTQSLYVVQEATYSTFDAVNQADEAVILANQANSVATEALTIANTSVSDSAGALSAASTANVNASLALSKATTAEDTANEAIDLVKDSIGGEVVLNYTDLPASPVNGTIFTVVDSTGVENLTPLNNLPTGFVGDNTLSVKLQYSSSQWDFLQLYSTNPDARYLLKSGDSMEGDLDLGTNKITGGEAAFTGNVNIDGTLNVGELNGPVKGIYVVDNTLPNSALVNSTISGVSLGGSLSQLSFGSYLAASGSYNGSSAVSISVSADSANTANTVVARDSSGNFSAGSISASSLSATGAISSSTLSSNTVTSTSITTTNLTATGAVSLTDLNTSGTITTDSLVVNSVNATLFNLAALPALPAV